ncbi:MAG: NUDIX domain-containing protein [Gemmatimonadota bacterium]
MTDRYGIQGRIDREEFARGQLPEGADPVVPRPAATTVLARPGVDGPFELLLLKRPTTTRFAAGAYVFPGGVVDEADGAPFWIDRLPNLPNLAGGDRAAATAAIRELFEETGILLSDDAPMTGGSGSRDRGDPLEVARMVLLAEERSFEDVARELGATFTRAPMTYFARWVTPRRLSRRYDALFFLVALPDRDVDVTITEEHDAVLWVRVDEAIDRFRRGELPMLFPTWKTIEGLASFTDLDEAIDGLVLDAVEPIEPRLDVQGNTVRLRMPEEA